MVAGDAFDYRIIDNLVSPELGKGSFYTSLGKTLPAPQRYYSAFARWDQLALLRASRDNARHPGPGLDLAGAREDRAADRGAGRQPRPRPVPRRLDPETGPVAGPRTAQFSFVAGDVRIEKPVTRAQFEAWIAPELTAIETALDEALQASGLPLEGIDRVFLTGGTSLTPAVRALFHRRFGAARIETGGEFESIAAGLALIGLQPDVERWTRTTTPD